MANAEAIAKIAAALKEKGPSSVAANKEPTVTPGLESSVQKLRMNFGEQPKAPTFQVNKPLSDTKQSEALVKGAGTLLENVYGAPAFLASGGNPLTGKALVKGGGSIPRGFSEQVSEATKPVLGKYAPIAGFAAGLLEPLPGGPEAKGVLNTIAKLSDLKEAEAFAKSIGVADDLLPTAAEAFVKAQDVKQAKSAYESILKLQQTTKKAAPVARAATPAGTKVAGLADDAAKELSASGETKTDFLQRLGKSIDSPAPQVKSEAEATLKGIKEAGYTPGSFYDAVKRGLFGVTKDTVKPPFPVPEPTTPVDSAIAKLVQAISEAKPVQKDVAKEQSAALARRAAKLEQVYARGGGEQAYFNALGKLKGELTSKQRFEGVRNQLTTGEVSSLFDKINFSKNYSVFEKTSLSDGLQRILRGEIPEPKQLSNLEDLFGHDVVKALQKHAGFTLYGHVVDILNIPRTLMTAFDMSAPFRQGVLASVSHPVKATSAFNEMFRQAFSQKNFETWLNELKSSPDYQVMKRSGLYIADPRDLAGGLNAREEGFISKLAESVPGIRASQRAYLAYLNKLRVDIFRDTARVFTEQGTASPRDLESLAEFVNVSTGRGNLGRLGRIAPELNTAFFSPRLIASRLSMLNPVWYAKQTPAVRKEAVKSMIAFVGVGTTLLTIAKMGGADVEADPRSTDFGKVRVGNTRWDIWGGFQQWARVFAQLASGQRKTTTTKEVQDLSGKQFPFQTRFDVALNFGTGKLAPIPALAVELLKGEQVLGGDLTVEDAAIQNTIPLYLQDVANAYADGDFGRAVAVGVPGFFGVGTATYSPINKKSSKGLKVNLGGVGKTSPGKVKIKLGG